MTLENDLRKAEAAVKAARKKRKATVDRLADPTLTRAERDALLVQLEADNQALTAANRAAQPLRDQLGVGVQEQENLENFFNPQFVTAEERRKLAEDQYLSNPTNDRLFDRYVAALQNVFELENTAAERGLNVVPTVVKTAADLAPVRPTAAGPTGPQQGPQLSEVQRWRLANQPVNAAEEQRMRTEAFASRVPGFKPPAPTPTGGVGGAATPVRVSRADVDAALAAQGIADTPENRKAVRAQLKKGEKKPLGWEALVKEQAGEYAYLLDPQYEGVPELLRKAVNEGWFENQAGRELFMREFKKTPYSMSTDAKQVEFDLSDPGEKRDKIDRRIDDIRTLYGAVQFDQATLEQVATTAARNQASEVELGRLVYRAAFKRGAVAPDFTAPVAAQTALGGADADRIRAIYRAYGQRPDNATIARILAQETDPASGVVMTEDMLRNNLRDIAKVSYAPFADLLDRGVSVETIFSPYQQIAARVLEKSPDQVALVDGNGVPTQFASALMGEKPMSLTDWITKLKADDRYGWQFTSAAKQQATNLVMDLEKAFGYRA